MQTDIVDRERSQRMQEWERLIDLLNEADVLQQKLLGDVDEFACREFHEAITTIAEDLEDWAAEEEKEVDSTD